MAQTFVSDLGTLVIPQAAAQWSVANSNAGIATRGVIALVGESTIGPSYAEEAEGLTEAIYGPSSFAAIQAKYGSGPLVDAYRMAANPSADPSIRGAPSQIVMVKTNTGTKASSAMAGGYGVLQAKSAGALGNLINYTVATYATEVAPSLTATYINFSAAESISLAANGGSLVALTLTDTDPAAFVTTNAASLLAGGITLTGGTNVQPANGLAGVTANVTVAGNVLTIALVGGVWATTPHVGDTLVIADTSSITGAANANSGQYVVTTASSAGLVATKLVDYAGSGLTAPVPVSGATANAGMCDTYAQVLFTNTAAAVAGLGKSLTFYRDPASSASHFYINAAAVTASRFVTSTTEGAMSITVSRRVDNISDTMRVGGSVAFTCGKTGTASAPVVVGATTIAFDTLTVNKADFATLADLAAYVNAQTGWYAYVAPAFQSLAPSVLDLGTFEARQNGVASTAPARIKKDAYAVAAAIANNRLVEFSTAPTAGLPAVAASTFLAGGAKGGTTDAAVEAALTAAGKTRCNFVVALFSQDAATDIADNLTDATSTYTIDGINAYVSAHVTEYSKYKRRRARQGFVSKRTTFAEAKTAAQTIANYRVWMGFQDVSTLGAAGLQWFNPWMGAVIMAGMQAAAFYRPSFNKSAAVYGVRQYAGDFDGQNDDEVEEALLAGLSCIRAREGGGYAFVSDQTTYSADENFVFNSVQAIYAADLISATIAQRLERAFVGQSFADVTAGVAMSYLKGIMADLKRLKLIAASSDAVDGYKDANIVIAPPSMQVSCEVKLATGVYFIPINLIVSQISDSAQG